MRRRNQRHSEFPHAVGIRGWRERGHRRRGNPPRFGQECMYGYFPPAFPYRCAIDGIVLFAYRCGDTSLAHAPNESISETSR